MEVFDAHSRSGPPRCSGRDRHAWGRPRIASTFPAHRLTQAAGLWHLEGLVGLDRLPERGAWIVAGVLPVVDGSGAPARAFAILP